MVKMLKVLMILIVNIMHDSDYEVASYETLSNHWCFMSHS